MSTKIASHNAKIRLLLFFTRPFHVFNVVLLFKMWNLLSYGPSTFPRYWGKASAADITQWLWREEFSPYVWWFLLVVIVDVAVQEYLPLIRGE